MSDPSPKRHGTRNFLLAILGVALLGALGHYFFESLPSTLQEHLSFLK